MRAQTPLQSHKPQRRVSMDMNEFQQPNFKSSIPRVRSTIANARAANSQPSFDFIAQDSPPRSSSRGRIDGLRQSLIDISSPPLYRSLRNYKSSHENNKDEDVQKQELDDLRAENKTLKYTIENFKQDQELIKLRHENELRDISRRADEDFKKTQQADAERTKAVRQLQASLKEIAEIRESADYEITALQKKIRETAETSRILEEKIIDSETEHQEETRGLGRKVVELESKIESLQKTTADLQNSSEGKETILQDLQEKLFAKESICGELETEILRLKAHTSDDDTLSIIKRELSEQISHISKLEVHNRELMGELKHLRQIHKSVEVTEEEKRSLQRKLDAKESIEIELNEERIQRQRLEDERLAWTAYLQSQAGPNGDVEFDSPEAVARTLIAERLQSATFLERIGTLNQELFSKESIIQDLEKQKQALTENLEKLKISETGKNVGKIQLRLERQKALAIKEAEYLRAQLRTYDTEDLTFQPETFDEIKMKRISDSEDLVQQYRNELQILHEELAAKEISKSDTPCNKRKYDDSADNDRQDTLMRKLRNLQSEFEILQNTKMMLEKDLSVTKERLDAIVQQNNVRILTLRSNPTSDYHAIKQSTLDVLRKENAQLLSQLKEPSKALVDSVPSSTLAAAKIEHSETLRALESEKKRNDRLMKVWGAKSTEFRQMVISLLGWDIVFMRDGKTRMTSFFYPSKDDDENSIVFDGEKGTMKISGGPESAFAIKISNQVRFWCHERGSIPCFLAALTLEFWEEKNTADDRARQC
ncbi:Spindle assembly checkpoint component MAD1 [Erysiphe neolycopersici]|uniref:Spindle assembly checkpoint component MAD1 n=1 Tax=Erysiphe neolycopersici TaxID=212602 RepID=A0A420HBL6_9PEZI|nr:Spindle assembly checkpoint component MAD1 [Erysiphe neolycopersici]